MVERYDSDGKKTIHGSTRTVLGEDDNRSYDGSESYGEDLDTCLSYLFAVLRNGEVRC
jgi:hypothetical protein